MGSIVADVRSSAGTQIVGHSAGTRRSLRQQAPKRATQIVRQDLHLVYGLPKLDGVGWVYSDVSADPYHLSGTLNCLDGMLGHHFVRLLSFLEGLIVNPSAACLGTHRWLRYGCSTAKCGLDTAMTEMILLGAGASRDAGVPTAYDMTSAIAAEVAANPNLARHSHLLNFLIGGLLFQRGIRNESPFGGVDVEELFNAALLLADRNQLEMAPFIGSWHSMVDELDLLRPTTLNFDRLNKLIYESIANEILGAFPSQPPSFAGKDIDKNLTTIIEKSIEARLKNRRVSHLSASQTLSTAVGKMVNEITTTWLKRIKQRSPRTSRQLGDEFERAVEQLLPKPGGGQIFQETTEWMTRALISITWVRDPTKVEYLAPLLDLKKRQRRLVIATLNYDNCVELMADSNGVPYYTGVYDLAQFGEIQPSDDDDFILLKLHGSIDWIMERMEDSEFFPMPHNALNRATEVDINRAGYRPAIIFGQRNKLTAEGPYLEILRNFQRELANCGRLTVIGYSFRDPHVNEFLSIWLNRSPSHRMRVVSPNFSNSNVEYAQRLARVGHGRIVVVEEGAAQALPKLFGDADY